MSVSEAAKEHSDEATNRQVRRIVLRFRLRMIGQLCMDNVGFDNASFPGENYSVGPTLTFLPTISADGQSVDLDMIVNVAYLSPTSGQ